MRKISVLIVDDHSVVRQGLSLLLSAVPDIEVAGQAAEGRAALALARNLHPMVVLMDLAMPLLHGVAATTAILRELPQTRIVVLTSYADCDNVHEAIAAGATGFIPKQAAANDLVQAIRDVSLGKVFFSPSIARHLRGRSRPGQSKDRTLSPRETEVLHLVSEGLTNKQIGAHLGISYKTVEKHRQKVMDKLGIHDIAGLTRYAVSRPISLHPDRHPFAHHEGERKPIGTGAPCSFYQKQPERV